jgi:hypothetical protein
MIIFADNMHRMDGFEFKKEKILPECVVDTQCLHSEQPKMTVNPFEIYKDESEAQERGKNYSFCVSQSERKVNNFSIFRDETDIVGHMQNGSDNLLDPVQHKSQIGQTFKDNIQILHNDRRENQISEPTDVKKENCPLSYFRDENLSPDSGKDKTWCPHIHNCNCEGIVNPQGIWCSHIKSVVDAPVSSGK